MGGTYSSAGVCFYPQGLTLVKQLFPAADGLAPGGGNAASPKVGPDMETIQPLGPLVYRALSP